jgi:hypothetical protein
MLHQQCFHVFLITQHAESNISSIAIKALYIHIHNLNMVIHCVILYTDMSTDSRVGRRVFLRIVSLVQSRPHHYLIEN